MLPLFFCWDPAPRISELSGPPAHLLAVPSSPPPLPVFCSALPSCSLSLPAVTRLSSSFHPSPVPSLPLTLPPPLPPSCVCWAVGRILSLCFSTCLHPSPQISGLPPPCVLLLPTCPPTCHLHYLPLSPPLSSPPPTFGAPLSLPVSFTPVSLPPCLTSPHQSPLSSCGCLHPSGFL